MYCTLGREFQNLKKNVIRLQPSEKPPFASLIFCGRSPIGTWDFLSREKSWYCVVKERKVSMRKRFVNHSLRPTVFSVFFFLRKIDFFTIQLIIYLETYHWIIIFYFFVTNVRFGFFLSLTLGSDLIINTILFILALLKYSYSLQYNGDLICVDIFICSTP